MISTVKREIAISKELHSKIEWENDFLFNILLIVISISLVLTGKDIIPTPL